MSDLPQILMAIAGSAAAGSFMTAIISGLFARGSKRADAAKSVATAAGTITESSNKLISRLERREEKLDAELQTLERLTRALLVVADEMVVLVGDQVSPEKVAEWRRTIAAVRDAV